MVCNSADSLQADHGENRWNKVRVCSDYIYWASNGGEQALQDELDKCTVKCYGCHKMQTDFELQRENLKKESLHKYESKMKHHENITKYDVH